MNMQDNTSATRSRHLRPRINNSNPRTKTLNRRPLSLGSGVGPKVPGHNPGVVSKLNPQMSPAVKSGIILKLKSKPVKLKSPTSKLRTEKLGLLTQEKALLILKNLASGVDPYTGLSISDKSPYQNAQTVRALFMAIEALKNSSTADLPTVVKTDVMTTSVTTGTLSSKTLGNARKLWKAEETRNLLKAYNSGLSLDQLALKHQRSKGSIKKRLIKLGKLKA